MVGNKTGEDYATNVLVRFSMTSALTKLRDHRWTVLGIVAYALFMDYFIYGLIVPLGPYSPAKVTSPSQLSMLYGA